MKNFILLLSLVGLLSSCYTITVQNDQMGVRPSGPIKEKWHHTFIFGLISHEDVYHLDNLCGRKRTWSLIETEQSFVNGLVDFGIGLVGSSVGNALGIPTLGYANSMWTPLQLNYQCGKGKRGKNSRSQPAPENAEEQQKEAPEEANEETEQDQEQQQEDEDTDEET